MIECCTKRVASWIYGSRSGTPPCRSKPATPSSGAIWPRRTWCRTRLHGHPHRCAQPPERTFAERDISAMRARDVAGDCEPKPGSALVLVARVVQPQERPEHILPHARGDAGPIVIDGDDQPAMVALASDRDRFAVAGRVRDQVCQTA